MPTATQFVNVLSQHLSIRYNSSGSRDCYPADGWDSTDCSCFQVLGIRSCGVEPGGLNSTGLQLWCQNGGGKVIGVDAAIKTKGALLFVWGYGPEGHVACSRGDGTTLETPAWGSYGHASGVGNAHGRGWTAGGLMPGFNYTTGPDPRIIAEILRRRAIAAAMYKQAIRAEQFRREVFRRLRLFSEEEAVQVPVIRYGGRDNAFYRASTGKLGQLWWDPVNKWWASGWVNDMAQQPQILVAEGATITARTRELNQTTNDIDLYYMTPEGKVGHTWWTGSSWGAQLLGVT